MLTALLMVVGLITMVGMVAVAAVLSARWNSQTAADAAALAAALDSNAPDTAARRLAEEHGAHLIECECDDGQNSKLGERTVIVEVATPARLPGLGSVDIPARAAAEFRPSSGGCPLDPRVVSFVDSWGAPRSGGRTHQGTDLMAPHRVPVFAVADGVVETGTNTLGGNTIWLHSDDGPAFYYAHLDGWVVASGDRVGLGDIIATNGNTGNARHTPPHVHFQHHPNGRSGPPVNPYPMLVEACYREPGASRS